MLQNRKILLLGAGGHCLSVLGSLANLNLFSEVGVIDRSIRSIEELSEKDNFFNMGISLFGTDDDLNRLYTEGYTDAFVTVGSMGDTSTRKKLYHKLKEIGFNIPNIIDKSSTFSNFASLGEGNFIGKNAVINAGVTIGKCAIVNSSATIEHQCNVNDFAHIAPGRILCGNVVIGANTHVGAGCVVKQGLKIGSDTIIGMGSVVISDIRSNVVAFGNPCREVEHE